MTGTIVTALRRMTGASTADYTIGEDTYWTDEQLQAVLDRRVCERLIQVPIELYGTIDDTGHIVFITGRVPTNGTVDTDTAIVVNVVGAPIDGATVHDDGRVDFDSDQAIHTPLLSGLCYDLNGAAADVMEAWASAVKLGYDISTDGQSMSRSQRHAQLLKQAAEFRSRILPGSVNMIRTDMRGRYGQRRASAAVRAFERIGRRW